jgi:hypothetical protein
VSLTDKQNRCERRFHCVRLLRGHHSGGIFDRLNRLHRCAAAPPTALYPQHSGVIRLIFRHSFVLHGRSCCSKNRNSYKFWIHGQRPLLHLPSSPLKRPRFPRESPERLSSIRAQDWAFTNSQDGATYDFSGQHLGKYSHGRKPGQRWRHHISRLGGTGIRYVHQWHIRWHGHDRTNG